MGILIVDDSDDMRASTKSLLEAEGFTDIFTAPSAEAAFRLLGLNDGDEPRPPIDVILMDIMMPHLDGIEACRRIKAHDRFRDVPVLMVTAKTEDSDLAAAFAAGAIDYIHKPIKRVQMLARLRSALTLKQELDQRRARQLELLEVTRQLREANQTLERLSSQDALTGLANRRTFNAVLHREWARAVRDVSPLASVMIDVDHFKQFNDHYGHPRGDECLRQVAHALREQIKRPGDVLARYGGEEFVGLLTRTGVEGALAVAEEFRAGVEKINLEHARSPKGRVTISLGVAAVVPGRHDAPESLISAADQALYEAKRQGRNKLVVYNRLLAHTGHELEAMPH